MILRPSKPSQGRAHARQRGVAIIVVLVVLAVLTMLLVLNSRTLARTKQEILLLERKHQQRLQSSPVASPQPVPPTKTEPATDQP